MKTLHRPRVEVVTYSRPKSGEDARCRAPSPHHPYMRVRIRRFNKNVKTLCCLECDPQSRPWEGRGLSCCLSASDLLKAGFSSGVVAASSGRTVDPVVHMRAESGKLEAPGVR